MMKEDVDSLKLWVFRPPVAPVHRTEYDAAFRLWLQTWRTANAEMDKETDFPSDAFTRQTEIITLFHNNAPVALICHRHTDFGTESTLHDTLFLHPGMWRDEDKAFVRNLGGVGILGSQITVHPSFRKTEGPISMKYLIVLLSLARAQAIGAETIIAAIRAEKGLERVFGGAGCITIAPHRPYGVTHVDLVAFQPQKSPIQIHPDYQSSVQSLWDRAQFSAPFEFKVPKQSERKAA